MPIIPEVLGGDVPMLSPYVCGKLINGQDK